KLLDFHPIVLLIDDLHLGDEATLILLRRLILRGEIKLFICGTSAETKELEDEEQMAPLERFYSHYFKEVGIRKIKLTALNETDIGNHIQKLFPNVSLAENFEKELAQISQG
ncbi:hypothetical protein GTO27_06930, partial [Candidatus Bathyarchaeota archaeon]|nr:hypothetical protein [Candidatus Bathyarchaeota archaeon]